MAFGKDFYLSDSKAASATDSAKYVFCALVSDKSTLTLDPRFCSDEVGQTVDLLMKTLEACTVPASQQAGISALLLDTTIEYYLMQAIGDKWIAIKRKKQEKGFSFYNPMGSKKEIIYSSTALMEMLQNSYGVNDETPVIAVKAK